MTDYYIRELRGDWDTVIALFDIY